MVDDRRVSEETKMHLKTRLTALAASLIALVGISAVVAGPALAYDNVQPGYKLFKVTQTTSQAGGHPDVSVDFEVSLDNEFECEENCLFGPRQNFVHWPEGFIGNPHVAPKCTLSEFSIASCPSDAQVGYFNLKGLAGEGIFVPLYNMETNPDQAGLLAFTAPLISFPVQLELSGRTESDYGLDAVSSPTPRLPFPHLEVFLWGVPASHDNDWARFVTPMVGGGLCVIGFEPGVKGCPPGSFPFGSSTYAPPTIPPAPFLQNPTTCGVPLTITGEVEYYGGTRGSETIGWPETTSCNQASFTPSVTAKPTTSAADTPTGLDNDLKVPQTQSAITPSPSEMKVARVTLPEGFSINPGAADGKVACPDILSSIGTRLPANCPEFSKIGTLTLDVAALPKPLPGALYLAEPKPGEPYRVLLAASGFATNVKLLGTVETDPQTGQVSVVFGKQPLIEGLPQAPLQEFDLHVFGSERGLLATPSHCGTYKVDGEFTPWNSALTVRHTTNLITIDQGPGGSPCPNGARPLSPQLEAGVADPTAGTHSPFTLVLKRNDGEQNLTGLGVTTPPGFSAVLAGIPYCPESAIASIQASGYSGRAEQAAPACPTASQVGTAVTGAGAGTHPLYTPGKVYLAGPYKGAPLSLVVVIPAVTGPYDLGNVVVRNAITVNPVTAQVTVTSDPLPQILEGIPLRTRSIRVALDRPGFALNPTNCDPFSVNASISGDEGGQVGASSHFQAANCAGLSFAPKLGINLRGSTKRRGHPALRAVLTTKPGEANLSRVTVVMPKNELLDNSHIGTVCTRVQFAAKACPADSVYGTATAITPLLDQPLSGNVYLRAGPHKLPDLVADLHGQFNIEVAGRIDSVKRGGLRARFETIPDAPVTKFVLDMAGGKKGLLVNSGNLCKSNKMAEQTLVGQNGARLKRSVRLQTACGSKASRKHRRHHRTAVH
jgi:hypothetical protein